MTGTVQVSMHDAHMTSVALLDMLTKLRVEPQTAAAGVALTLGRMVSPTLTEANDPKREVEFVQEIVQWAMAYWAPIVSEEGNDVRN